MKKKITGLDILAIISAIGMIVWILTNFFGGMIIYFLMYYIIIIPFIILYLISLIDTIISFLKKNKKTSKIKLFSHWFLFTLMGVLYIFNSGLLKSKPIISAVLKDDLFHYQFTFRKNGDVENKINGFMGYSKTYYGTYTIKNNLIIFKTKPYDNSFIPDTLLIDRKQNAVFMYKNKNGEFDTKKNLA